ncbi:hypothetical protein NKH18_03920 [Streptomyces sp. M10(2022)]
MAGAHGRIGDSGEFSSEQPVRRRRFMDSIARVTPGKISMSACAVGSARATLAVAVRYGGHRLVSGSRGRPRVPVYNHRSHHGPLAGAMATVFAMSLLHRTVLDRWEAHRRRSGRRPSGWWPWPRVDHLAGPRRHHRMP